MLQKYADYVVYQLLAIPDETHLGKALDFFLYDTVVAIVIVGVGYLFNSIL